MGNTGLGTADCEGKRSACFQRCTTVKHSRSEFKMPYLHLNALLATFQAVADAPHLQCGENDKLNSLSNH